MTESGVGERKRSHPALGGTVHVIGAGLAGLAAAIALIGRGRRVALSEAGPAAGGRCRSYFDRELACRIDNGNHLLLAGNRAAMAYLETIGARASLGGPGRALFPFLDLASGERWVLAPNRGRLPWWMLSRTRRVPGTRARDYLAIMRLRRAGPEATVREVLGEGRLVRLLLDPLAIAALNTRPESASARLFAHVLAESLAEGGAASVPLYPRAGLSETFIDPALAWLRERGAVITFGKRINALEIEAGRLAALGTAADKYALGRADGAILAVPAPVAQSLLPGLRAPDEFEAILNLHFRIHAEPGAAGFIGLIGGLAEWVFVKPGIVSVTVSAANHVIDRPAEDLAAEIWPEVCQALALRGPIPPVRVVKERRATFQATPAQEQKRPATACGASNLALAGDWTATGLPGTIEGAIRSGERAAEYLCA